MVELSYQPFFCEENIWRLCRQAPFQTADARVAFISNRTRQCAMWRMRAADGPTDPVFWDYHVILLRRRSVWEVWDPETTLGCPTPAAAYAENCFDPDWPAHCQPMFRIVPADDFAANFSSDRRHMLDEHNAWRAEPPPWPAIFNGRASNLNAFIDMDRPFLGEIIDLPAFKTRFSPP